MLSFVKRHQVILASIILSLFSLHLSSLVRKGTGGEVIVRAVLSAVTSPFERTLVRMETKVKGVWGGYIYLVGQRAENENLKKTIYTLTDENNKLKEELSLDSRMKELLKFKEESAVPTLAARIIGMSNFGAGGGWARTLTLDRGSLEGAEVDMPVVSPRGVVGRIIEVTQRTSTVLLLVDPRSNIDVTVQRTRIRSVAEGNGTSLTLKYVRPFDDVQEGDVVTTAGLSGIFPKGLYVGEVTTVERGEDNLFRYIEVKPASDIRKLEEVLIVKEKQNLLSGIERAGKSIP
ncbi:MAG: rod shape-determining protein MreC [Deltaproteobacteria bacterium]|nr:rod shape-determining protein MreC [Deltaproteobacteria bacterium]